MKVILFLLLANTAFASDWLILANAPAFSESQFKSAAKNRKILALDGIADQLKKESLRPNVILGDFDSISDKAFWGIKGGFHAIDDSTKPYEGKFGVRIVPAKDQNHTDLQKAISYCDSQGATSILILNATGGRMDHTLGNIGNLRRHYKPSRTLIIQTEKERIQYVKDGKRTIRGKPGDGVAIMGYPKATMTTTGLAYNGTNYQLELGKSESTSNSLAADEANIAIQGEAIIISPL